MPQPKKPPDRRVDRRRSRAPLQIVDGDGHEVVEIPRAPAGLLKSTKVAWDSYWTSAMTVVVRIDTDLPALARLFSLYDERERAYRGYRKERLVEGSQGQRVLNPLARVMSTLDTEIRHLEDKFGLTPKARLELGIDLGNARRALKDVNADLDRDADEDEDEDPRAALELAASDEGRPQAP